MIYIVTGHGPRCGSAMMMQCLEAGGIELAYDPACDVAAEVQADDDYHPNPDGLYELPLDVLMSPGFPRGYEGKAIKVFPPPWGPLTHLEPNEYKVVWMYRDAEVRRQSFIRFHQRHGLLLTEDSFEARMASNLRDMAADAAFRFICERADMQVTVMDYESVIAEPKTQLKALGWPIDVKKAAKVVDPSRRRF